MKKQEGVDKMMNIYTMDILKRDNRDVFACLRYILKKCCKQKYESCTDEEGESWCHVDLLPMDFMQLKWIIDRCNFIAAKWYGLKFFDYEMLFLLEDSELVPETFDCKWGKNKKEEDFMSIADKLIMNKVIRSWKWYGRFTVAISEWWWIKIRKAKIKA